MEEKILDMLQNMNKRFDRLDERFDKMDERLDKMDERLDKMDERFEKIEAQLDENTQILRALEHAAEVNKAEHDKMSMDIAELAGEVKCLRKDLTNVELITSSNWNEIVRLKAVK